MKKAIPAVLASLFSISYAVSGAMPLEPPKPSPLAAMLAADLNKSNSMPPFKAKNFSHLLGIPGFSDGALELHFKLYQGYVKNTNLLLTILDQYSVDGMQRTPQFQEIKRRLGWEYDGMRLHELYFGNMGGQGTELDPNSEFAKDLIKNFGSLEEWKKDFIETGMLRGIGWSILYKEPIEGRLINTWIGEHDIGHLAGGTPLLIMDVWEHAYLIDYGIERGNYIKAFFENINWDVVTKRYPTKAS